MLHNSWKSVLHCYTVRIKRENTEQMTVFIVDGSSVYARKSKEIID